MMPRRLSAAAGQAELDKVTVLSEAWRRQSERCNITQCMKDSWFAIGVKSRSVIGSIHTEVFFFVSRLYC